MIISKMIILFILKYAICNFFRFLKLQRNVYIASYALRHFALNTWMIEIKNTINLNIMLPSDDVEALNFNGVAPIIKII